MARYVHGSAARFGEAAADSWHLDRRIPLATILAIMAQGAAILLWGSGVSHNIDALQRDVKTLQADAKGVALSLTQITVELAKLQVQVQGLATAPPTPRPLPSANGNGLKRRVGP